MLLFVTGMQIHIEDTNSKFGLSLDSLALYWHCVDIVWIVIFTIIYLIP